MRKVTRIIDTVLRKSGVALVLTRQALRAIGSLPGGNRLQGHADRTLYSLWNLAGNGRHLLGASPHSLPLRNRNSLHPIPPPHVFNFSRTNPRSLNNVKTCSGFATSNGYPPSQSTQSCTRDIPRVR